MVNIEKGLIDAIQKCDKASFGVIDKDTVIPENFKRIYSHIDKNKPEEVYLIIS